MEIKMKWLWKNSSQKSNTFPFNDLYNLKDEKIHYAQTFCYLQEQSASNWTLDSAAWIQMSILIELIWSFLNYSPSQ